MKRWIQAFVLLASPLLAFDLDCCGDFEIGAEALYWKACACEWQYGLSPSTGFNNEQISNVRSVNTGYDWGFRIFGEYTPCGGCSFLALDWTYLRTTDSESPAAVQAAANFALNNAILAKLRTRYNRVNLRGGYFVHQSHNLNVYAYAGARWIDFDLTRDLSGKNNATPLFLKEKSELSGGALEVGVGGLYRFDCGINLVGSFGPLAAIGKRKHSLPGNGELVGFNGAVYPNHTICFLGLDFRIGLNSCFDCSCFTVTAEIGYEVNYYFNALSVARSAGDIVELSSTCCNIGFAGPYASLGLRF